VIAAAHAVVAVHAATHAAHTASNTITVPPIRWLAILPPIIMIGGAVVLLGVASLVHRPLRARVSTISTVVISGGALGVALWQWSDVQQHGAHTYVKQSVVMDGFSVFVVILVAIAMLLSALVADGYLRREGMQGAEFHVLAMVSASGAMLMAIANDLIIIFLGLEILSIALYVLTAFNYRRAASGEAALKYFILGGFSSAIFIYGIALTYGATGSTNLTQISDFLSKNVVLTNGLLLAGLALMIVGFAFKVAAVPFHMWTPDVYQGAPSPVTGFMAAIAKAGAFAAMLRVLFSSFGVVETDWRPIIYGLAVLSLVLGAFVALRQRDVKRMLAYSSINHAGFILLGVAAGTARGASASLYYLFAYMFMVIGSFAIVTLLGREGDADHDLSRYRGLAGRQPVLALALAVLLLAQAGAPFTTGLWAKLQVVFAAISAGEVPLGAIAMVTAVIAAYFYLRLAVLMYAGGGLGEAEGGAGGSAALGAEGGMSGGGTIVAASTEGNGTGGGLAWATPAAAASSVTTLNEQILLAGEPEPEPEPEAEPGAAAAADAEAEVDAEVEREAEPAAEAPERVPVPALTGLAIALCTGVTVLFGVWPQPLIDFANHATLLFLPK
jgi:NADH-quinone oxidoreductase subunit N